MSDTGDGRPPGEGPADPPDVGSVGEEAAKLLGALSEWASDPAEGAGLAHGLGGLAGPAADVLRQVDEHIATGAPECTFCPVCRTVHVVRTMNPEVRAHLAAAGASFFQAVATALASLPAAAPQDDPAAGFEHIDLDDDPDEPR